MSGGVDSSVAAALLLEQGYEVIGVTLKLWQGENEFEFEGGCCSLSAVDDARRVAQSLNIPHYVLNMTESFNTNVVDYFVDEYCRSRTPNPCIACNKYVKFDMMLNKAISMDIDYISTGHYAQREYLESINRYVLKKSKSLKKDQTYVLYNLTQHQLEHTLFPLGTFENKEEIREIARKYGFRVANKPDSQEICFVEDGKYSDFVKCRRPDQFTSGNIITTDGKVLGKHNGLINYTIGQRKGLGIAYEHPLFVVDFDTINNNVIVGRQDEIFSKELYAENLNWILFDKLKGPIDVNAKIRYSSKEAKAIIIPIDENTIKVTFEEPQRAITPGQSIVFYQDDIVVGGGVIRK